MYTGPPKVPPQMFCFNARTDGLKKLRASKSLLRRYSNNTPWNCEDPLRVCSSTTEAPINVYFGMMLFWRVRTSWMLSGFGVIVVCDMFPVFMFHTPSNSYSVALVPMPLIDIVLLVPKPPCPCATPVAVF